MNRMSDDLISRKDVITIIENMIFEVGKDLSKSYLLQDAKERIRQLNTAFDKEKAMDELQNAADLNIGDGLWHVELRDALEIVEKGGIE